MTRAPSTTHGTRRVPAVSKDGEVGCFASNLCQFGLRLSPHLRLQPKRAATRLCDITTIG